MLVDLFFIFPTKVWTGLVILKANSHLKSLQCLTESNLINVVMVGGMRANTETALALSLRWSFAIK